MEVSLPDVTDVKIMSWSWEGRPLQVVYEQVGEGAPLLLLPAFSTISTRAEMRPLAERLADSYRCILVDWPGFGDSDRPPLRYRPPLYLQFLHEFVERYFESPPAVVAAGHAAAMAVHLGAKGSVAWPRLALLAPTWRGPLPTVMGQRPGVLRLIEELVRLPVIGPLLYRMNTSRATLRSTAEDHVFADPEKVTDAWIEAKYQLTQHPNARFATAAFLTGGLDVHPSRDVFLFDAGTVDAPVLVLIGEKTPPRSRAEMDALVDLPGSEHEVLPGSLSLHEEAPDAVLHSLRQFLTDQAEHPR